MNGFLKENERLVQKGHATIPAPGGKTVTVPTYQIATFEPSCEAQGEPLNPDERLVMVGTEHSGRKSSEERFEAAQKAWEEKQRGQAKEAGRVADGEPLYIKEAAAVLDATGLTRADKRACNGLASHLAALYAAEVKEKLKEISRPSQGEVTGERND